MDTDEHRFCRLNLKDSRPPSSHGLVTGFSTGKTQARLSPSVFIGVHLWLKSFPSAWIQLRRIIALLILAASPTLALAAEPTLKVGDPAPKLQTGNWFQAKPVNQSQNDKTYPT